MPQTAAVITGSHDNRSLSPQSWHRSPSKQAILKTHSTQLQSENSKYAKYKSLAFPRSLISYSFLPFLFLVVLASLPTSSWHQKQQGTRASSSLLQLPAYQRHLHAYCTSEETEQQNMRLVPIWFTGYREEGRGRQENYLTFWSSAHHLEEPISTPVSGQLVNLLRLMKQSQIKTASSPLCVRTGTLTKSPGCSDCAAPRSASLQALCLRPSTSSWVQAEPLPGRTGAFLAHPELHPGSKQDPEECSQPPPENICLSKMQI